MDFLDTRFSRHKVLTHSGASTRPPTVPDACPDGHVLPRPSGLFHFSGSPMISTRLPVDADRVVKSALSGPQVYPAPEQIKGGGDVRHSTQFAAHRISSEVAHD